jgi:protein TonB
MAKIDLTSLEWCDLIFQGKNKAYGAYVMRADSPKRHNRAMLLVVLIALAAFSVPALIKLATPEQKEEMTTVTEFSKLIEPEVPEDMKRVEPLAPPPEAIRSSVKFTAPVIKEVVNEENEIKSQDELNKTDVAISIADVKGNDEEHGKLIEDVKQIVTQAPEIETTLDIAEQMPSFPGGNVELMSFIQKNLKYPVIDTENGTQGRVICQFVVGKDGSVTNVTIARSVSPTCDKEAIRVIQSMPRWIPGKQNGKTVAVKYTVPIVFKLQ